MSNFTTPTRRMMALLLGLRNFEPNTEARDLLEDIYLEDVSTLVLLHSQSQTDFAAHYDNRSNNRASIWNRSVNIIFRSMCWLGSEWPRYVKHWRPAAGNYLFHCFNFWFQLAVLVGLSIRKPQTVTCLWTKLDWIWLRLSNPPGLRHRHFAMHSEGSWPLYRIRGPMISWPSWPLKRPGLVDIR